MCVVRKDNNIKKKENEIDRGLAINLLRAVSILRPADRKNKQEVLQLVSLTEEKREYGLKFQEL